MDTSHLGTARWCRAFSEADFPRCKAIALEMLDDGSERQFALKSLAQALHYMGNHAQAKLIAEEVRRDTNGVFQSSVVPPFVSMGIVLARIAQFEGRGGEAMEIAEQSLARAKQANPVSVCQALAMACVPVATWEGDAQLAHSFARMLIEVAEGEQLAYWRVWGTSMADAVRLRFDLGIDSTGIDLDSLDALQADHLAMLDPRAMSQLALERATDGLVGWTAPEILRIRAATAGWYDPIEARALLTEARELAETQGAVSWLKRIEQSEIGISANSPAQPAT